MEYMSPEQAMAQDLNQRSDLFSAGLIFYEMLTGQMPFRADSALASLIRRTQERASISREVYYVGEGFFNLVALRGEIKLHKVILVLILNLGSGDPR
jgi:serine/threonine protein kinase